MKTVHCGDLVSGCPFVARAETAEEAIAKAAEHAKAVHAIAEITPELAEKVKAAVRDE